MLANAEETTEFGSGESTAFVLREGTSDSEEAEFEEDEDKENEVLWAFGMLLDDVKPGGLIDPAICSIGRAELKADNAQRRALLLCISKKNRMICSMERGRVAVTVSVKDG